MKLNKITMAIAGGAVAVLVYVLLNITPKQEAETIVDQTDVQPAVVYDKAGKFDK